MNSYVVEMVQENGYRLPQPELCPEFVYRQIVYHTFELDVAMRPSFEEIRVSLEDFVQANRGQISVLGGALLTAIAHLDDPTFELRSNTAEMVRSVRRSNAITAQHRPNPKKKRQTKGKHHHSKDKLHLPSPKAETAAENEDFYLRLANESEPTSSSTRPAVPASTATSTGADLALIKCAMQDPELEAAMRHADAINPQEAAAKFAPIPDFFPQITRMSQC